MLLHCITFEVNKNQLLHTYMLRVYEQWWLTTIQPCIAAASLEDDLLSKSMQEATVSYITYTLTMLVESIL